MEKVLTISDHVATNMVNRVTQPTTTNYSVTTNNFAFDIFKIHQTIGIKGIRLYCKTLALYTVYPECERMVTIDKG